MKNNKGFTLIELLVTIAIIIAIAGSAVIAFTSISNAKKQESWNIVEEQILTAAKDYFKSNEYHLNRFDEENQITDSEDDETLIKYMSIVSVGTLVKQGYLNRVTDPRTNKLLNNCSLVYVTKEHDFNYVNVTNDILKKIVNKEDITDDNLSYEIKNFLSSLIVDEEDDAFIKKDENGVIACEMSAPVITVDDISEPELIKEIPNPGLIVELYDSKDTTNKVKTYSFGKDKDGILVEGITTGWLNNASIPNNLVVKPVIGNEDTNYVKYEFKGIYYENQNLIINEDSKEHKISYIYGYDPSYDPALDSGGKLITNGDESCLEIIEGGNKIQKCKTEITATLVIKLDRHPPVTEITLPSLNGEWYTSNVNVTYNSNDNLSGLKSFKRFYNKSGLTIEQSSNGTYTWNNTSKSYPNGGSKSPSISNGAIDIVGTVSASGARRVKAYSCDFAGNCDYSEEKIVNLDKTTPSISIAAYKYKQSSESLGENNKIVTSGNYEKYSSGTWTNKSVYIKPTFTFGVSGAKKNECKIEYNTVADGNTIATTDNKKYIKVVVDGKIKTDGSVFTDFARFAGKKNSTTIKKPFEGIATITCTATSNSGKTDTQLYTVKRDITPPTVELSYSFNKTGTSDFWTNSPKNMTATFKDNFSLSKYTYYWNKSGLTKTQSESDTYKWKDNQYKDGGSKSTTISGTSKTGTIKTSGWAEGARKTRVYVYDEAGNSSYASDAFGIDKTAPDIVSSGGGRAKCIGNSNEEISWGYSAKVKDALSGSKIQWTQYYSSTYCDTYGWHPTSSASSSFDPGEEGIHTIFAKCSKNPSPGAEFYVYDGAGNETSTKTIEANTSSISSSNKDTCNKDKWYSSSPNR